MTTSMFFAYLRAIVYEPGNFADDRPEGRNTGGVTAVTDPDPRAKAVGRRIVEARRELGMSQEELRELLGCSARSMQAYESGEVIPYKRMRDLERVLNRPITWFLHGEATDSDGPGVGALTERLDLLRSTNAEIVKTNREILELLRRLVPPQE